MNLDPSFSPHFVSSPVNQQLTYDDNDSVKCNYIQRRNFTYKLSTDFGNIPENLILNLCCWILLLLLFTFLRKKAWNYGRMALLHKRDHRYAGCSQTYAVWTQLFYGESGSCKLQDSDSESVESLDVSISLEKGFFSWFKAVFKITDEQILRKCGLDAVQYLSFQRHIIVYVAVICVLCLCVILPVNFQGDLEGSATTFGHTTMNNLNPESPLLWVHVAFAFLYLPLGIFFLRHFYVTLKPEETTLVTRTLMIDGIPREGCTKEALMKHFQEAYPECIVKDIQFAYNIKKLSKLDQKREAAMQARIWCETYMEETGERPMISPHVCGRLSFCGCCKKVDGLEFYAARENKYTLAVEKEKAMSLLRPLGIAFITFQTENMAELVYKDHQRRCKCNVNPPSSSLSRTLNPHDWEVVIASAPEDIFWENLTDQKGKWYFRAITVNLFLFIILLFFTTPYVIAKNLKLLYFGQQLVNFNETLSDLLQPFVLWIVSVMLPVLVGYSDQFLYHWTRSAHNHSVMTKTYLLLLFMILILQSLGLTSLRYLLEALSPGQKTRWWCIFLSDNGAFFVNYVITSGFIGSAMELIRFPELFVFAVYLCLSYSKAEQASVRKAALWEFEFGTQYAWFLLIFSVVITYSLACPLIVIFGLLTLCFKHLVDCYNIYFAYAPSKINQGIHATAINFVVGALLVMQVLLFFFCLVRKGWDYITMVTMGIILLTLMVFIAQISHNWFRQLSPITYTHLTRKLQVSANGTTSHRDSTEVYEEKPFTPYVLKHASSAHDVFMSSSQSRTYGTNEESIAGTPTKEVQSPGYDTSEMPYQRY